MISDRSARAMPPAPKLAWKTRSDGGALIRRGMKNGAAMVVSAVAFRKERRENGGDEFIRGV